MNMRVILSIIIIACQPQVWAQTHASAFSELRSFADSDEYYPPPPVYSQPVEQKNASGKTMVKLAAEYVKTMPAKSPGDAARNVLLFMRRYLKPAGGAQRGAHEWSAEQVLNEGSTNGCVESAKVFFEIFKSAYPHYRPVYLDSFNSACPKGGHAVVEITDSGGSPFIIDSAFYPSLPDVLENFNGGDITPHKRHIESARYENSILCYDDNERRSFRYYNPCEDKKEEFSRYIIYSRHAELPNTDNAEKIEKQAREQFSNTGKVRTYDRYW